MFRGLLVFLGHGHFQVLHHDSEEEEELRPGQSHAHAHVLAHAIRNEVLVMYYSGAINRKETFRLESPWVRKVLWVVVKLPDVVVYESI